MPGARPPLDPTMHVEIWSDVVCPWCYVGTRRFDEAVKRLGGAGIEVVHRAFELDPAVPPGGQDLADYLARKFGGAGRASEIPKPPAPGARAVHAHFPGE